MNRKLEFGQVIVLSVLAVLSACTSTPKRPTQEIAGPGAEPVTPAGPAIPPRKPGVIQKRGGGYYKDDGPGDDIPDNLDEIPDAQPRDEPLHRFANRPYVVLGKSYVPETRVKPFVQRGVASWYGKKFHGQKTSIGEPYDMFSMTAAHPTLAIPSYVRVTNPGNGKSVVVRVTDRGPFHADRIIDLSYAAAYRLGYIDVGSTVVEVESVLPGDTPAMTFAQLKPPLPNANGAAPDDAGNLASAIASSKVAVSAPAPSAAVPSIAKPTPVEQKGVFVQLGAFSSADNAESLRSHLSRELDWLGDEIQINAAGGMHRVHLGPYATRNEAEKVAERIRVALGFKPTFVTR